MQSKSLKLLYGPQRPPNGPIMSLAASPTTHSLACSVPVTLSSTLFLKPVKQSSFRASPHMAWSALTLLPLDICSLPLLLQVFAQWISGAVSGYCLSNNNPNPNPTPNTPFPHFLNYFPQKSSLSDKLYSLLFTACFPHSQVTCIRAGIFLTISFILNPQCLDPRRYSINIC